MRTKEFEQFIDKTSKIVERALTGSEDILGPSIFMEDLGDEDEGERAMEKANASKEKLVSLFTFQDNVATQRTITSLEWQPNVSSLIIITMLGERFADVYLQQVQGVLTQRVRRHDQSVLDESQKEARSHIDLAV